MTAQVRDRRLRSQLRRAITVAEPSEIFNVSAYVFMECGYVVGAVQDADIYHRVEAAARGVTGLRRVTLHLPIAVTSGGDNDLMLVAEIKARLTARHDVVQSRVSVRVLNARAVLLGVVGHEEQARVIEETEKIDAIAGVDNFMLSPEEGYARLRLGVR